jgi:hypothetical protein
VQAHSPSFFEFPAPFGIDIPPRPRYHIKAINWPVHRHSSVIPVEGTPE